MAYKNNLPKPSVDPKTGEIKNANFNSSIWDAYNVQSEEQLKDMESLKPADYAGLNYEGLEETEDSVPITQKLNYRFDPSSFTFKAYDQNDDHVERTFMEKVKDNKTPIIQGGLSIANSILGRNNMMRDDKDRRNQTQDIYGTDPIWDYNEMYGNNTNGGSQFQPIIKAEKGAKVRTMLKTAAPIEIEGGEFLVLPDGTTELAKGPKHKDGGIDTMLPDGAIVYSNKLKPEGSKKTFAQLAKENDTSSYVKTLKDPYSDTIARNTAERMLQRKQQKLTELFQQQQMMNGNSSGEPMMMNGGYTEYADGGINPPIYTSNPKDPRIGSFNDSMNLYNAYKFQKHNTKKHNTPLKSSIYPNWDYDKSIKTYKENTPEKAFEYNKKLSDFIKKHPNDYLTLLQKPENSWFFTDNSSTSFKNTNDLKKYLELIKLDNNKIDDSSVPIAKYYEKLRFEKPIKINYHSSPDLYHSTIKPIGSYHDGIAYSPIYKQPVQPVIYKPNTSQTVNTTKGKAVGVVTPTTLKTKPKTTTPVNNTQEEYDKYLKPTSINNTNETKVFTDENEYNKAVKLYKKYESNTDYPLAKPVYKPSTIKTSTNPTVEPTPTPKVERKVLSVEPEEVKAGTKTTSGKQIGSGTAGGRIYKVKYDNGETEILNEYEYRSRGLKMENGGKMKYELGGELDLSPEQIEELKTAGYKLEIL